MSNHNPFIAGPTIKKPTRFYGRVAELQAISSRVGGVSGQSLSIVGARRMGKSSLIQQIKQRANLPPNSVHRLFYTDYEYVIIDLDVSGPAGQSNRTLMEHLRRALKRANLPCWDQADNGDLTILSYTLEDLEADYPNQRLVLCLDEFEAINAHPKEFDGLLEALRYEGSQGRLAIVTASATPLAELCQQGRIKISPFFNIFTQVTLGPLAETAWRQLLTDGLGQLSDEGWAFFEQHTARHPFLTQLAGQIVWQAQQSGSLDWDQLAEAFEQQAQPYREYDQHQAAQKRQPNPMTEDALQNLGEMDSGISPQLYQQLRQVLLNCDLFTTDKELIAMFVDARLTPWRNRLPTANNPTERVEGVITLLYNQHDQIGQNALVLLLQVLSERVDSGDACHQHLVDLANKAAQRLPKG